MALKYNLKAIFFFVLTTLSFSIMSIIANEFVTINALLFYFVTSIFSAIAVITYFILTRTKFPQTKSYKLYIFRGMLNAVAMVLWCMSVKHIAVTDAMAISYISPIFTIILATWILKEKITSQGIIAIIAGFIGMLLILRPGFAVVTPTHSFGLLLI
jgi:drug/metabolite transporter (DMT)-like permease